MKLNKNIKTAFSIFFIALYLSAAFNYCLVSLSHDVFHHFNDKRHHHHHSPEAPADHQHNDVLDFALKIIHHEDTGEPENTAPPLKYLELFDHLNNSAGIYFILPKNEITTGSCLVNLYKGICFEPLIPPPQHLS
jgi:hypothetical protein